MGGRNSREPVRGGSRPQALGASYKLQATSWVGPAHRHLAQNEHGPFDMEDFIGYLVNDGKSYTRGHSSARLVHLRLLPDIGNGSLMILRNSAAEALQQHPHKVREAGGTGVAGLWFFKFSRTEPQASSPQATGLTCSWPLATSSRISFPS